MEFIQTENTEIVEKLRAKLYQNLNAPIDAMWEQLYINFSQHYLIKNKEEVYGYCCINSEKCLVQIFLIEEFQSEMENTIAALIDLKLITSASLSSNEPISFNVCLSMSTSIKTNTFCFQNKNKPFNLESNLGITLVTKEDIPDVQLFLKEQVGMDDTFGYTENLVSRKEIFMVKTADIILATSECRVSDSQPQFADLGIIVNKAYQGQGLATQIMQAQVNRVLSINRKPICSTTVDNIAAKKAIENSGFFCSNIIFDIHFSID